MKIKDSMLIISLTTAVAVGVLLGYMVALGITYLIF